MTSRQRRNIIKLKTAVIFKHNKLLLRLELKLNGSIKNFSGQTRERLSPSFAPNYTPECLLNVGPTSLTFPVSQERYCDERSLFP